MAPNLITEWLETNGSGGYACGSLDGQIRRFWHGLYWHSRKPPADRVRLVAGVSEALVRPDGSRVRLSAHLKDGTWESPELAPAFDTCPCATWRWRTAANETLRKRVILPRFGNRVILEYVLEDGTSPRNLALSFVLGSAPAAGSWPSLQLLTKQDDIPVHISSSRPLSPGGRAATGPVKVVHQTELDCEKEPSASLWQAPEGILHLEPGKVVHIVIGTQTADPACCAEEIDMELQRRKTVTANKFKNAHLVSPHQRSLLAQAADQFIVRRHDGRCTIMAGYPWFTDWGRDTMISLQGLCIATGRYDDAKSILQHFLAHADKGIIPNLFPESGLAPRYNTLDATLWMFEAIFRYVRESGDKGFLLSCAHPLLEIIDHHRRGTHNDIKLDEDGLLRGGSAGSQLTWMDVKIDNHVPTPRHGKPVEIQGLWFNALMLLADVGKEAGFKPSQTEGLLELAARCEAAFAHRFVLKNSGHLADVIDRDGPGTADESIRPNMIIPFGLTHNIIPAERRGRVLRAAASYLVTPRGLRTLSSDHPSYKPIYKGDRSVRDRAYHQGTVWMWLLGPYIKGVMRECSEVPELMMDLGNLMPQFLQHFEEEGCINQASEIFDAESPHRPRGCFAQAWSVAALIDGVLAMSELPPSVLM